MKSKTKNGDERLIQVLDAASPDERRSLAAVARGLESPPPEWHSFDKQELDRLILKAVAFSGSSKIAWAWRKVTRGAREAGVAYAEIVDGLLEETRLPPGLIRSIGHELDDHLYARELIITLILGVEQEEKESPSAASPEAGRDETPLPALGTVLEKGMKAVRATGFTPFSLILGLAKRAARPAAGKAAAATAARGLGSFLGPAALALLVADAGRAVYSAQAPDNARCMLFVAAVGSLRMKYFPLPGEKIEAIEKLIGNLTGTCPECGNGLRDPEAVCLGCRRPLHHECGTAVERIDTGDQGRICRSCRREDLSGKGNFLPDPGNLLSPGDIVRSAGYRLQVLGNHFEKSVDRLGQAADEAVERSAEELQRLRKDIQTDLNKTMRSAFAYLYIMFFTTVFLTLFGIAYFKAGGENPDSGLINPGQFFRLSILVMVVIPTLIWFLGALWKASNNAKREDFEAAPDGKRLRLKDYLFGFLYYDNPVQNIWGPIALIGATVSLCIWMFLG